MTFEDGWWARDMLRRTEPTKVDEMFAALAEVLDPANGGDEGLYRDLCEAYTQYDPTTATPDHEGLYRELREAYTEVEELADLDDLAVYPKEDRP